LINIEEIGNQYKILKIEIFNKSFAEIQGQSEGFEILYFEKINFAYIFQLG
tara:strand:- start:176 stop:328 length:153 start_codon:yes stop_codon:yes gene_type:complete